MVGSVNSAYQQQIPVLKTLNPGITEDKQGVNTTIQQEQNSTSAPTSQIQSTETRNTGLNRSSDVLEVGKDTGLSSRSADRGQTLDISV